MFQTTNQLSIFFLMSSGDKASEYFGSTTPLAFAKRWHALQHFRGTPKRVPSKIRRQRRWHVVQWIQLNAVHSHIALRFRIVPSWTPANATETRSQDTVQCSVGRHMFLLNEFIHKCVQPRNLLSLTLGPSIFYRDFMNQWFSVRTCSCSTIFILYAWINAY